MKLKEHIAKIDYREPQLVDCNGDLNQRWYVEYYVFDIARDKHIRKRYYKGINSTKNKKERYRIGHQVLAQLKEVLRKGVHIDSSESKNGLDIENILFKDAISYAVEKKRGSLRKTTFRDYKRLERDLLAWVCKNNLNTLRFIDFKEHHAHEYFDYVLNVKNLSNKSHNNLRGYLCTIFNFYMKRYPDVITRNPVNSVSILRAEKGGKHKPFSKDELKAIKDTIVSKGDLQLLLFIEFIYYTCTRPRTETRLLKIGDIREKSIIIRSENAKNSLNQAIRIFPGLEEVINDFELRKYPDHFYVFSKLGKPGEEPVGKEYFYDRHRKVLEHLGLFGKGYDMYGYKHTCTIELVNMGWNIRQIQEHLRHHSISQTETYMRDLNLILPAADQSKFPRF